MSLIDWRSHIVSDPQILCGKPTLRGTRLSVEFVLDLLAAGWDREALRQNYPNLTEERIRAVLAYAAETFVKSASICCRRPPSPYERAFARQS